ncbi:MAG TPA: murein biosynthesis integral membrane protein MurJ [Mycobacteriales bacterium]|jgi:putative peptidoglycan lipid II flippase|nr:murein biosynthesis integral membrane protein MurJ [Mycobacteriales bacterium]
MTEGSLQRSSGLMALGTIASRATGFVRLAAVAGALGLSRVADPYNVGNTLPNIVYELLLGGILTSVVVRPLVQAAKEDDDDGEAFAQALLTFVVGALAVAVILGEALAPWIVRAYGSRLDGDQVRLATALLRLFLPQVLFYGAGATMGAILNARGRFGAPMAVPVLNNVVVVVALGIFVLLPGPRPPSPDGMTRAQFLVLGLGTTAGIVAQTVALVPFLRRAGFRFRPRRIDRGRLRALARLGGWVLTYVIANQVGYLVIVRLATGAAVEGGYTAYTYAFQLFSLPHAIVAVSVITALGPAISGHAVAGDLARVRTELSNGLRLIAVVLVPAAVGLVVLARPVAVAALAHGALSQEQGEFIGRVLVAFACGLLPFSAFQLLTRVFYWLQDSRTPAVVNIAVNAVNVGADVVLAVALHGSARIVAMAAGYALSYVVGAVVLGHLLRARLGGLDGRRITRTTVRALVAAAIAGLGAYGVEALVRKTVGAGLRGSLLAVLLATAAGGALYVVSARRMRLAEVESVVGLVRGRLRR